MLDSAFTAMPVTEPEHKHKNEVYYNVNVFNNSC